MAGSHIRTSRGISTRNQVDLVVGGNRFPDTQVGIEATSETGMECEDVGKICF